MNQVPEEVLPPVFKWFASNQIAASGRPGDANQLKSVAGQGIRTVISVTAAPPDESTIEELGMKCVYIPNASRDLDALDRAVDALHDAMQRGERTLVH
jgi:hypothetical protein